MSFKSFRYELTIRESHLDTFGHVNNAVYLTLFEEARWDVITSNGYGMDKIRETGAGPTILEAHLKFLKELRLRQRVVIESRMTSQQGKIGRMTQELRNEKGDLCCTLEIVFGLFDTRARKLIEPTTEWMRAVGLQET